MKFVRLFVTTIMWMSLSQPAFAEITADEFQKLHRELRPAADAPWRSIPWKISLLDAQRQAIAEKKPLFIWAMDGHPLGCT